MGDPMDIDSYDVAVAGAPREVEGGDREQLAEPTRAAKARLPSAGRRLGTKKSNARLLRLFRTIPRLVRGDAIAFLDAAMENVLDDWITILTKTNLPSNIASSDPLVITIFQQLDGAIDAGESIRSRLAHIQLMRVFLSLEGVIARERRAGQIRGERGQGDKTVAINIYKSAQQGGISRHGIKKRKQIAKWWTTFAGPSPLFVTIYSEVAERVIKNYRKRDKQTLESLASAILEWVPGELVKACRALAEIADRTNRPGQTLDRQQAVAGVRHDLRAGAK